ncbi:MAG: beta-eliminating lyase-related protein [Gammaproteobacteria bacterium]|jgi:threonine aldolase|nr:beta-eliminating lyase-related protein [Gammaproteobacteria bacterium]
MTITRRDLAKAAGVAAGLSLSGATMAQSDNTSPSTSPVMPIRLSGDGIGLQPLAYTELLNKLCKETDVEPDNYLLGGEVEKFEQYCAGVLGKEMAVFIPSGTLANQLALRELAGTKRRVIVPGLSHVYNDTGDASQNLANLNLIPLAQDRATFTLEEVESIIARTEGGRVTAEVGAILIESPVRRLRGEMVDWDETKGILDYARERDIGTHLDGARLFIASAYTGITPAQYSAPFDTVYVSLWKCFNSNVGAILAGPRSKLENMFHTRRMFGGNLFHGWPSALVAKHYMEGFTDRLRSAVEISETFYSAIKDIPSVQLTRVVNGTNLAGITLDGVDIAEMRRRLAELNIMIGQPNADDRITLSVNETWNQTTGELLADAFARSLA